MFQDKRAYIGFMHNFHCKTWAATVVYFRRLSYIMTNYRLMIELYVKIKNKTVKRLPLDVKCDSINLSILWQFYTISNETYIVD